MCIFSRKVISLYLESGSALWKRVKRDINNWNYLVWHGVEFRTRWKLLEDRLSPSVVIDSILLMSASVVLYIYWTWHYNKELVIIIIIIIMLCHQYGYPWPSLITSPYCLSLLAGPQAYITYPHRAAVCRFELVALLLLSYVSRSIEEHHLWARSL